MKKLLSLLLAITMVAGIVALFPVFADEVKESTSFSEGSLEGDTVSTTGISGFVSSRVGAVVDTSDLRFILAVDLATATEYETIDVAIDFYYGDDIVKSFTMDMEEIDFYRTVIAARKTYTAADGDALFGAVISGVPNAAWTEVAMSVTVSDDTTMKGVAYPDVLPEYNFSFAGEGTESAPYLIQDETDLYMFSALINNGKNQNAYFKMTADIDMSGVAYTTASEFFGVFDGNGHVIKNLTINEPDKERVGFIGCLSDGTIKNLGFEQSLIIGGNKTGTLAGRSDRATIINCFAITTVRGVKDIGGFVGMCNNTAITNCFVAGVVTSNATAGGIAGGVNASVSSDVPSIFDNVYSIASVTSGSDVGAIIGWEDGPQGYDVRLSNLFCLEGNAPVGNNSNRTFTAINEAMVADGTLLAALNGNAVEGYKAFVTGRDGYPVFEGTNPGIAMFVGEGTESSPYLIQNAIDLVKFSVVAGFDAYNSASFKLTADVNMKGYTYKTVSEFFGVFDGNGHVIKNLTINETNHEKVGLIGYMKNGTIKNLGIENATVVGANKTGVIVGFADRSTIMNCYVVADVTGVKDVGILVGRADAMIIKNCFTAGSVSAVEVVGGIIGADNYSAGETYDYENLYTIATVTGNWLVGAIAGYEDGVDSKNLFCADSISGSGSGNYTVTRLSEAEMTNGTLLNALNGNTAEGFKAFVAGSDGYPVFEGTDPDLVKAQ